MAKNFAEARVFFALEVLFSRVGIDIADLVDIYTKPGKMVKAKRDLKVGQLRAVPEAPSVKTLAGDKADQPLPSNCALAIIADDGQESAGRKVVLVGSVAADSVALFLCFGRTTDPAEANLQFCILHDPIDRGCRRRHFGDA